MGKKGKARKGQKGRMRMHEIIGGRRGEAGYITHTSSPPSPPVNQAEVDAAKAAMLKDLVAWRPSLPQGEDIHQRIAQLDKLVTYLPTAKGVKEIRRTPFGHVVQDATSILGGEKLEAELADGVYFNIPRLPWDLYAQTVMFFKAVQEKMKAEVLIQFFYSPSRGEWRPFVPPQEVSGGSVKHTGRWEEEGDWIHVWDIHSHNTMGAFFSSVDDADEKNAVRLYGVIGKITQTVPASRFRMWTGFKFINLSLAGVVEMPTGGKEVKVNLGKLVSDIPEDGTDKETLFKMVFNPFEGVEFPAAWWDNVTERKYSQVVGGRSHHTYKCYAHGREFDSHEDMKAYEKGDLTKGRPSHPGTQMSSMGRVSGGTDQRLLPGQQPGEVGGRRIPIGGGPLSALPDDYTSDDKWAIERVRYAIRTVYPTLPKGWAGDTLSDAEVTAVNRGHKLLYKISETEGVKRWVRGIWRPRPEIIPAGLLRLRATDADEIFVVLADTNVEAILRKEGN